MKKINRKDILKMLSQDDVNVDGIDPSIELNKQGIDSLDMMNLFLNLEEEFKIKISDEDLQNKRWITIDEIVENVNILLST